MHVLTQIDIDAPVERVWDTLIAFDRYGDWNPFVLRVRGEPVVGAPVRLTVRIGGRRMGRTHLVSRVEPPHVLAWTLPTRARWWMRGERVQRLEALGPDRCRYTNDEQVHGIFGLCIGPVFGPLVRRGLEQAGAALKAHTERT